MQRDPGEVDRLHGGKSSPSRAEREYALVVVCRHDALFPTRVRLSGMAIGTQVGFALGGLAPAVADAIAGKGTSGWVPVAALTLACSVVAAIAVATARETCHDSLERIDSRTESRRTAAPLRPQRVERSGVTG